MAKKSSILKNEKKMEIVQRYAKVRAEIKAVIADSKASFEDKEEAFARLRNLPRNANPIRVRNRCMMTGRPRGFYGKFGVCRLVVRDLASLGNLPGVRKASW